MKIVTIVGARPQFIKAAAISRELRRRHTEILVHTGQHYDYRMSGVFFDGLQLPAPDINLGVGSKSHGSQTARMLESLEKVLCVAQPDWVLVYGDTNSTLAGGLAAAKLSIPVVHVEAGLRSFNRRMPEEINRVVVDHVSTLLLCPGETAVRNLANEGIDRGVHVIGDVMLDVLNWARQGRARPATGILQELGLATSGYVLTTIHRSQNTDDVTNLRGILEGLNALDEPVVFPVHPRALKAISAAQCELASHVRLIDPVGYLDMMALTGGARLVLTDSGGLQKEAYWLGIPCLTLRQETEWVETVSSGWNVLVGSDSETIVQTARSFQPANARPALYGDGHAAARCVELLSTPARQHHQAL